MKRLLTLLVLVSGVSLFALETEAPVLQRLGLELNTGFNINNAPEGKLSDYEFLGGFNNRALINLDLALSRGPWNFLGEATILSLRPALLVDVDTIFSPMLKLGFLEYDDGFVFLGAGRRKQSMGVSDINLFVNRDMPFFDGLNLSVGRQEGFRFDSLISAANLTRYDYGTNKDAAENYIPYSKYFLYHALSYTGQTWFLMIGEAAAIATPGGFSEFNIFANAHNEHSERVNVGLEIQFAKTLNRGRILLYAMGAVDDLPSGQNDSTLADRQSYPDALAAGLGARWHVFDGVPFGLSLGQPGQGYAEQHRLRRYASGGPNLKPGLRRGQPVDVYPFHKQRFSRGGGAPEFL
jgi:hypothetical protein